MYTITLISFRTPVVVRISVCLVFLQSILLVFSSAAAGQSSDAGLRGVFLQKKDSNTIGNAVVRIAIRQISGESERLVRLDHPFHSGDKFRFEVSSNRDGWLYLLHRQGTKDPQPLWPEVSNGNSQENNRVLAGQTYVIPGQDVFKFDDDTGTEFFYVAITRERGVPRLTTQGAAKSAKKPTHKARHSGRTKAQGGGSSTKKHQSNTSGNQLVQLGVKGFDDPLSKGIQTLVYDPGKQDQERYFYFSSPKEGDSGFTVIEFQLRHEK